MSEPAIEEDISVALKRFEGLEAGSPTTSADPVNQAMIRHWVEAMGDENPVYVDDSAALENGFTGVIAPPTMLQAWTMRGYRASMALEAARKSAEPSGPSEENTASGSAPSVQDQLFRLLDGAGFTSVVATNCEQHYRRPVVLGDRITSTSVIEAVSERKTTALGDGYFVTTRTDFVDEQSEPVATMKFRVLRFRPRPSDGGAERRTPVAEERPRRPRPAITRDNAFFFEGAREKRLLVQRCVNCGRLRHPPTPACGGCGSFDWDTVESSGRGRVYSYVVVHHPQIPAFDYPLPIAVVELEEGTRLVADLIGVAPDEVRVGMAVSCEFVAVDDELTLPMFRPAGGVGSDEKSESR